MAERSDPRVPEGSLLGALRTLLREARSIVVLGIGSELHGDDAAGALVARRLEERLLSGRARLPVTVLQGATTPENQTGAIKQAGPTHLVVVDAAHMGGEPGAAALLDPSQIGASGPGVTHRMPLSMLIAYLRTSLPLEAVVIGVQPSSTGLGDPLDPRVSVTVERLVDDLWSALRD